MRNVVRTVCLRINTVCLQNWVSRHSYSQFMKCQRVRLMPSCYGFLFFFNRIYLLIHATCTTPSLLEPFHAINFFRVYPDRSYGGSRHHCFTRSREVESAAKKIGAAALFARSEAIKRNAPVLLCAGTSGSCAATPATSAWSAGWRICYDRNTDGDCDTGTDSDPNPIRAEDAQPANITFTGPASRLQFNADGTMTSTVAAAFTVSSPAAGQFRWNVRVAASGASAVRKEAI